MTSLIRKALSKDNRFLTYSILVVCGVISLLTYLAVTRLLEFDTTVLLCFLVAALPLLIVTLHFLRTGKVL